MTFTADDVRTWLTLILSAIALTGTIWGWFQAKSRDNGKKIDELEKTLSGQRIDLTAIRHELDHMPSQDAVHKLELSIAEMSGDISAISKAMERIQRTSDRIETYLMEQGK